jgi:Family of unknown function (DUF6356)
MRSFDRLFTDHPRSVGESYFEHMESASRFGARMIAAGFGCWLHGLFPFLCVQTGSSAVRELHEKMIRNRRRAPVEPERAEIGAYI